VKVDAPEGETPEGAEPEVKLTVIEPAPKPTPVGVGAEGGPGEGGEEPADAPGDADQQSSGAE
jgi:hypothetical protein